MTISALCLCKYKWQKTMYPIVLMGCLYAHLKQKPSYLNDVSCIFTYMFIYMGVWSLLPWWNIWTSQGIVFTITLLCRVNYDQYTRGPMPYSWWRQQMATFSALPVTVGFPSQIVVTNEFHEFFYGKRIHLFSAHAIFKHTKSRIDHL